MLISLAIGIAIYTFNIFAVIRSIILEKKRFFALLPIIPWIICMQAIVFSNISAGWKLTVVVLITVVELFVDLCLSNLTRWVYLSKSSLHVAAKKNQIQRLKSLINNRTNINARLLGWSALEIAAYEGHIDVVNILISNGASLDAERESVWGDARMDVLGIAASSGHLGIVKKLISVGARVNDRDGCGSQALQAAIRNSHLDVAEYLLQAGAACDTSKETGTSALHVAVMCGNVDAVRLLLSFGADTNARDRSQKTPMMLNEDLRHTNYKQIEILLHPQ